MFNLPNILTLLRILLIPVFVGLFYYPSLRTNLLAALVFILAALTDFVDGYLARKLKQTTKFGAFLDPVADKIIVCTALVLIIEYYSVHVNEFFPHINLCVTLPSIVIIAREIVVSALREWMAEIGQRARVAVNWVGKWKTAIQMIAIAGLIWRYNNIMIYASLFMLQVATILTIMSMVMYLKVGLTHMFDDQAAAKEHDVENLDSVKKESKTVSANTSADLTAQSNDAVAQASDDVSKVAQTQSEDQDKLNEQVDKTIEAQTVQPSEAQVSQSTESQVVQAPKIQADSLPKTDSDNSELDAQNATLKQQNTAADVVTKNKI